VKEPTEHSTQLLALLFQKAIPFERWVDPDWKNILQIIRKWLDSSAASI
jgi:hypothetical protein